MSCACNHFTVSPSIFEPIKFSNHPKLSFLTKKTLTAIRCGVEPRLTKDGHGPKKWKRRKSYGTSRRSILKKTFSQEQVTFTAPLSDDPIVAIIGGGMSGLLCALTLEKRGIRSTVFDTGLHGLGGRMGTRIIDPQPLVFDHAAQFFTVSDPLFSDLVYEWSKKGLVRQSLGTIGELEPGGVFSPFPSSPPRYIAINGMRTLADSLLSQSSMVNVVRPCWISSLEPFNGMWHLSENGKPQGQFDAIVIAHNGKCANRLLASSGLPVVARQMKRLGLSSIWALLAAFEDPLPLPADAVTVPFEGAFVKGVDSVSWMANNTKKLFDSQNNGPHCWTIFSTAEFGKRHKVPQENIPTATAEKVKKLMLDGVENALGLSNGSLKRPMYSRVQLWGAALPTNTPGIPCIFDPFGRAGICGDWLLGSSLEAAALSGRALANHIADYIQSGGARPDEFAVGLHNDFQPLKGHDIGQFPGLVSKDEICDAQENIPTATAEKVKKLMLDGVENALGLSNGSLKRPMYSRVQLWGAALPTNTPGIPCIFDPFGRAGICGDWLLGSSLEAAALSGRALANHIADYIQSGGARPDEFAVGLHNDFQPLKGHDIGQFPGLVSKDEICDAQVLKLRT